MMASQGRRYLQRGICNARELFDLFLSERYHNSAFEAYKIGHRRKFSREVASDQTAKVTESRWHELPPVATPTPMRTVWKLDNKVGGRNAEAVTALNWVAQCCPTLPRALLHKLFRVRQVRKKVLSSNATEFQHFDEESPSTSDAVITRLRRVSGKTELSEGTVLCLPRNVLLEREDMPVDHAVTKTQHQPTATQIASLQSLVIYKDADVLVINKPPGLPVQGGSEIGRSLDSLMGEALCFEYSFGPKLVHRLDRETSGVLVLARTRESALLLHAFFRQKTATARQSKRNGIERSYWALVIGTPKQSRGRITAPVLKVVLDNGRADKIVVAHDISSTNAQLAITDYKVTSATSFGCTWLKLQPVTGRKHQLRVHCAEVLGTPILGDSKYGWRTQKEWLQEFQQANSELLQLKPLMRASSILSRGSQRKSEKGSIFSKAPALHLHCREMVFPDVSRMIEQERAGPQSKEPGEEQLRFVAPLPPHMVASRALWESQS